MNKKIFIIHGWTYTLFKWDKLLGLLKGAGYDPVMLKVPGLTEPCEKEMTLDNYVEWLKGKLQGEDEPIVIGHSNGGRIALAFENKYPGSLRLLILIASAGIYHKETGFQIKRKIFTAAAKFGKKITTSETLRKVLYKLAGEADYKNAPVHMRKTMDNLISVNLTPILPAIKTPTLIIWGKLDKTTPVSDAKLMHTSVRASDIFVLDDARHSPHFTHPEKVREKIIGFIKNNGL